MGDPKASAVGLESLLCVGFPIPTTYMHVGVYGTRPAFDRHPGTRLWTRPGLRWERGRKLDRDGKVRTNNSDDKVLRGRQEPGESRNPGYTRLGMSRSASDATEEPGTAALCPAPRLHPVFKTAHKTMDVGHGSGHPWGRRAPRKQVSLLHLPLQLGQSLRPAGPRPFSVALTGAVGGRKSRTAAAWEMRPRRDWQRGARTPAPSGLRALRLRSQKQLIPRDPSLSLPSSAQRYCHFYAYCIPLA